MTKKRKEARVSHRTSVAKDVREARLRARRRRQRLRNVAWIAAGTAVLVVVVFLVGRTVVNRPGEAVANMGNTHISPQEAATVTYNSVPPTSGPHYGQLAAWGVHDEPIPDGLQIHNLEDGGVGIWYDCPEGCPELVQQLEGIVSDLGEEGLLLAPYPDMGSRIALTAWNRIDKFEAFDEARIKSFIRAYRGIDHHVAR